MCVLFSDRIQFIEHYASISHLVRISAVFGRRQIEFTIYMEKHTEVEAFHSQLIHHDTYVFTIIPYKEMIKYT